MSYDELRYDVDDGIATVTLHRPDRLNAFTAVMHLELLDVFDQVDRDDDVRVVILTGSGRAFCAGADLESGGDTFDVVALGGTADSESHRDPGGEVALRINRCRKPVLAAINGPAVGVGATMTLPADVRFASDTLKCGFVFARRGLITDGCASWFLPRVVGIAQAQEWVLSGRVFGPDEALAGGLVRSVHPVDELLPAVTALAREIADNAAPVSASICRQLLWRMLEVEDPGEAFRVESRLLFERGRSADVREGVAAFLEKRAPDFPQRVTTDAVDLWASDPAP
ncbi:MAG: putative enoyl-CoA hydratase [Actinomycetia bacterium]|nr:putative enoyl-CoA hydratase [Actinomycetes bacterium]